MRVKKAICVILTLYMILAMLVMPMKGYAAENEENETNFTLYAQAAVLMDADSGRILYAKNGDEQLPMASTTKVMTLIVTLENANLDDTVTVSDYAAKMPDVQLNIRSGEKYRLGDLVYSLMLESHNDSAVAIAEHVGGSVEGFAKMMNQKARDIGCFDCYFITPNGLDATATATDKNDEKETYVHSTTASDLARILSYAVTKSPMKDKFLEITRTQSYSFSDLEGKRSYSCNNHNAFLSMMQGALSGKTGFTGKAGYCYVGALESEGRTYVVALLACGWPNNKTYKWSDTKKLMNYGIENFHYHNFDEVEIDEKKLQPILIKNGQSDHIGEEVLNSLIVTENNENQGLLLKDGEEFSVKYEVKKELEAPVRAGDIVGQISYYVGDDVWKVDTIALASDVEKIDLAWCVKQVWEKVCL